MKIYILIIIDVVDEEIINFRSSWQVIDECLASP